MKVRQFTYVVHEDVFNTGAKKEAERELDEFLKNIQFRDVQFSGISGMNGLDELYIAGMVLVHYEDGIPKPEDVVQMRQFLVGTSVHFREPDHKTLNDFLASADVKDIKYSAVSGRNRLNQDFITGLALVVYKPTQE